MVLVQDFMEAHKSYLLKNNFSGDYWQASQNVKDALKVKVRKKAKIRNRYNQALHLTQDTTLESNKYTIKHHAQESQEVSPFPAGDHKATINRQENTKNTK